MQKVPFDVNDWIPYDNLMNGIVLKMRDEQGTGAERHPNHFRIYIQKGNSLSGVTITKDQLETIQYQARLCKSRSATVCVGWRFTPDLRGCICNAYKDLASDRIKKEYNKMYPVMTQSNTNTNTGKSVKSVKASEMHKIFDNKTVDVIQGLMRHGISGSQAATAALLNV